jgi:hypothetical protein
MQSENGARCLGHRLRTISIWVIVLTVVYLLLRPVWTMITGGPVDWAEHFTLWMIGAALGLTALGSRRDRSKANTANNSDRDGT